MSENEIQSEVVLSIRLLDIIQRQPVSEPWSEGEKIPWNEPDFSRRMLKEHLSQEHDAASRRFEVIDQHVKWIHDHILSGRFSRILDLGCGPGLYTSRLSCLGHECVGIDYSPASIAYARQQAEAEHLKCMYVEEDIRFAEYGTDNDLVMLIFGEFNVFTPSDGKLILEKANRALRENGLLLLEPHTFSAIRKMGGRNCWYTMREGLFSDHPHACLEESFWNEEKRTAAERYFIIDPLCLY